MTTPTATEHELRFPCFGTTVTARVSHPDEGIAADALDRVRDALTDVHVRLTRFEPGSELSRLNADPRGHVPAGPLLRRFADAVRHAGRLSDGLVDATLLDAVEAAGYRHDLSRLPTTAPRRSAAATGTGAWAAVRSDERHVIRPPGVRLDSGGLGKGLAADIAAEILSGLPAWAIDCAGDLRMGGSARVRRLVTITSPYDRDRTIHDLHITTGAIATSGVTRRTWRSDDGRTAHHLIDPRTGEPARTGIVQATALAPTGLEAEIRAKTALLSGPLRAHRALPRGGAFVTDDGELHLVPAHRRLRFTRR
ncbi:FAD:protein FMN transferase [Paraconexibacter sp.]|uniref:FAD:protein FMN transferase n=1 Tax=Paraconexibacter sp. TaxID=2949640 RepID=UPI003567BAF0